MIAKPLFLIGFMASGKTKTGKRLANQLQLPFLDLDHLIETEIGQSISSYFQTHGEKAFRKIESKCLHELPLQSAVVALGGGTPCFEDNMAFIKSIGKSIYLKKKPEVLIGRLRKRKAKRPLVANLTDQELKEFVLTTLKEREFYYEQADFTIELENEPFNTLIELAKS